MKHIALKKTHCVAMRDAECLGSPSHPQAARMLSTEGK